MKARKLIRGLLSYIPYIKRLINSKGTGGSSDAKYCIDIYDLHKSRLINHGCVHPFNRLLEIGPGDSLGIGIAALIDNAGSYYGLDLTSLEEMSNNLIVYNQIKDLFQSRKVRIYKAKEKEIADSIKNINHPGSLIHYYAPSDNIFDALNNTIDVIFSTAVMEHLDDPEKSYRQQFAMLKPGGYISHVIDFGAHEFSERWYEHWYYSDFIWKILMRGRRYIIKRRPYSFHVQCVENAGFLILSAEVTKREKIADANKISRSIIDYFNSDDLEISGTSIVAIKSG